MVLFMSSKIPHRPPAGAPGAPPRAPEADRGEPDEQSRDLAVGRAAYEALV